MKQRSDITVKQIRLELEVRPFKRLTKDASLTAVVILEWRREGKSRTIDWSIEAELKYTDQEYDVILCLTKCMRGVRDEKKKEERSEQLEQRYVCSLISFNWLTLICSQPAQFMSPLPYLIVFPSPPRC